MQRSPSYAVLLSSALLLASCGGSPVEPSEVGTAGPSPGPTPPSVVSPTPPIPSAGAMTAQERSDWIDAVLFASGPSAGQEPDCETSRKLRWSDRVPVVDVVLSSRVRADQRTAIVTSLGQFNSIVGGGFSFNTRTGDVSRSAAQGQIFVKIENDVATACGSPGENITACAEPFDMAGARNEIGSGDIRMSPDSLAAAHEIMHLMVDACHPREGSVVALSSAADPTYEGGGWTETDVHILADVSRKGVLKANATRGDYVRAGLVLGTSTSSSVPSVFRGPSRIVR